MKIARSFAAIALLMALLTGCAGNGWAEFTPPDGEFSVQMPGKPEKRTESRDGIDGSVWLSQDRGTSTAYIAGFFEYPAGENPSFAMLDSAVAAYESQQGTTVSVRETSVSGHAGREMQAQVFGGPSLTARFYVVGNRVYTVTATTAPGKIPPDEVSRFLNSFVPQS